MGICEAPFQLKANCGVLVVDDFGRQRVEPKTLLNRWIVPLERRIDYLDLPNGRKVSVPFDPMVVFSTNLNPSALVDEAFLRRIPYKISVDDPSEALFLELMTLQADLLGFEADEDAVAYLIDAHYHSTGRPFRYCHARDLLQLVRDQCHFEGKPLSLSRAAFDRAARVYFIATPSHY